MQPQNMFCSNPDCPSCGQQGKGNIIWHHKAKGRLRCKVCKTTFNQYKDTPFFGLRKSRSLLMIIIVLITHGCPTIAIVRAFGLDRRTVASLTKKSGTHCQAIHEHLVEQPQDHGQIQADEIFGNIQAGKAWIAMAIAASSRLWLGAVVGTKRSRQLIDRLAQQVRRCSIPDAPILVVTDGLKTYVKSFRRAFALRIGNGKRGRPTKQEPAKLVLAQCIKSYSRKGKRYVCHGIHHCLLAIGTFSDLSSLIKSTQSTELLHTAYIERLNASFRQAISGLVRRSRCLLKKPEQLHAWVYLKGTIYNFCQPHLSLGELGDKVTPAMAAGITKHIWSIKELLEFQVPPPLWKPSKRGRRTEKDREILQKWRPDLATR